MNEMILIVEDNPDNMKLFAWTLEDEGYAFEGVSSAEEGLAALDRRAFDLVLMDIALPGLDGKESTRRIRAQPKFAHLPIIAVTAHASESEAKAIIAAGLTAVVTGEMINSSSSGSKPSHPTPAERFHTAEVCGYNFGSILVPGSQTASSGANSRSRRRRLMQRARFDG